MNEPTFDADGYPTDETLSSIKTWKFEDGYVELMAFISHAWWGGTDYIYCNLTKDGWIYELHTVGWSGNEEIIQALKSNSLFWSLCWEESRRGGHYKFTVKNV